MKKLIFCIFLVSLVISNCYEVDVKVTKKQPNESNDEHIDLTSSDSQDELVAYIESLTKKKQSGSTSGSTEQDEKEPSSYETPDSSLDSSTVLPVNTTGENSEASESLNDSSLLPSYTCKNSFIPPFIEKLSTGELKNLADLIDNVCNNDHYIHFFEPDFGWRGNPQDRKNFVKFLKEERVDSSNRYNFVVGMKFILPRLKPSYVNDVFRAYTDNSWFASNYIHPDNIDVKIVKINTPINDHGFNIVYNMIMNFEILKAFTYSVAFKSNFIATRLSEHFTVFTERSFPNQQMIRRHISFLDTSGEETRFTVFEFRQVDSKGLVGIAKSFMESMDASMMKAVYDNALIQTNK